MQGVFLIHTYNTLEQHLLDKAEELRYDVAIFDASDTKEGQETIESMAPGHVRHVENTGHNITSYFTYFADHQTTKPPNVRHKYKLQKHT